MMRLAMTRSSVPRAQFVIHGSFHVFSPSQSFRPFLLPSRCPSMVLGRRLAACFVRYHDVQVPKRIWTTPGAVSSMLMYSVRRRSRPARQEVSYLVPELTNIHRDSQDWQRFAKNVKIGRHFERASESPRNSPRLGRFVLPSYIDVIGLRRFDKGYFCVLLLQIGHLTPEISYMLTTPKRVNMTNWWKIGK
jgi:hypothetical protein